MSLAGVAFEAEWDRRRAVPFGDVIAPFIGRQDLIANKLAGGRPEDLIDGDRLSSLLPEPGA